MTMTDPIADYLTRIRNAQMVSKSWVDIPVSKLKIRLSYVLKEENFVRDYILIKNDRKFETHEWFNNNIDSQEILDSAYNIYLSQPFYQKLINTDLDNVITLIVKLNNDFVSNFINTGIFNKI